MEKSYVDSLDARNHFVCLLSFYVPINIINVILETLLSIFGTFVRHLDGMTYQVLPPKETVGFRGQSDSHHFPWVGLDLQRRLPVQYKMLF